MCIYRTPFVCYAKRGEKGEKNGERISFDRLVIAMEDDGKRATEGKESSSLKRVSLRQVARKVRREQSDKRGPCCDAASPRYVSAICPSFVPESGPSPSSPAASCADDSCPRRPPSTFLCSEPPRRAAEDGGVEYERPYTNHRATVLPDLFLSASPFRPPLFSLSFLRRSLFVLWQSIISLIYRILSLPLVLFSCAT